MDDFEDYIFESFYDGYDEEIALINDKSVKGYTASDRFVYQLISDAYANGSASYEDVYVFCCRHVHRPSSMRSLRVAAQYDCGRSESFPGYFPLIYKLIDVNMENHLEFLASIADVSEIADVLFEYDEFYDKLVAYTMSFESKSLAYSLLLRYKLRVMRYTLCAIANESNSCIVSIVRELKEMGIRIDEGAILDLKNCVLFETYFDSVIDESMILRGLTVSHCIGDYDTLFDDNPRLIERVPSRYFCESVLNRALVISVDIIVYLISLFSISEVVELIRTVEAKREIPLGVESTRFLRKTIRRYNDNLRM